MNKLKHNPLYRLTTAKQRNLIIALLAAASFLTPFLDICAASAQTLPPENQKQINTQVNQSLNQIDEMSEYYRMNKKTTPPPEPQEPDVIDNTPITTPDVDGDIRVYISQVLVDSSEILTTEEISAIISDYENREVSILQLQEAVDKINALYRSKNYITAKAVLPPQTIKEGVVRIQLIEGRLGQVHLTGNKHTFDHFFTKRIRFDAGELIRIDELEQQLSMFNLTTDVRVRVELKPGATFGTTDIVLIAQEPTNEQLTFFSDNAGSKTTGAYRFGLAYLNRSLTGNRDTLSLMPVWSKGSFSGSAAYSATFDDGAKIGISYDRSRIDIISGPFSHLNIQGYSDTLSFSLTQLLTVSNGFKKEFAIRLNNKNSETLIDGFRVLNTDVKTVVGELNLQASGKNYFSYIQHALLRGIADTGNERSFFTKYNLFSIYQQALSAKSVFTLRLDGQLTDDYNLPANEQFSLGGMSSVRGYPGSLISGDTGYLLSLEWSKQRSKNITEFAFIDHGGVQLNKSSELEQTEFLTSVGFGVTGKFGKDHSARLVVGFPLQKSTDYSPRVHFICQFALL